MAVRHVLQAASDWGHALGSMTRAGLAGERRCARCGIDARILGIWLDTNDVCNECVDAASGERRSSETVRSTESPHSWRDRIADPVAAGLLTPRPGRGAVDALVALSGGKDSLATLLIAKRELGLSVAALTLDNGFLLDPALAACRSWCDELDAPLTVIRDAMHDDVRGALARRNLTPWPCVACFDRLSRALITEATRLGGPAIVTGLRYRWPGGSACARASQAFAAYAPSPAAETLWVVNLPAAVGLAEAEERELLARHGWADPGIAGHSTNCLLPAHFERLHLERLGRPHESARFVSLEARQGVISREVAIERTRADAPPAWHRDEIERRLAQDPR